MPDATTTKPVRIPPALIGAGILIALLGFGLPSLISSLTVPAAAPAPQAATRADALAPRATAPPPAQNTPGDIGLALVRLVLSLAVVCGGCVLVTRYLGKKGPDAPVPSMVVVASLTVGRCAVHLVRAGERRMLLGTDASGVKALVELPGPDPNSTPSPTPNPFATNVPNAYAA
ncbi:flagellar biosynthetic protein FliO [Gemmata sp. JC717]|uniref:flagellar biosynthetic protein FliO n=1 Tax=Gemmata algarum TaxID=2975278 RepID=UPI0021BAD868|nr:flagellar biosynthetic protein FliO [Gemmata algarum]MDY3555263.1 flagellar biosynthetic protein FliO [Gemmata algarum]